MMAHERIGFIGGGNMASAILGGLLRGGMDPGAITVVEPHALARAQLRAALGVQADALPVPALADCAVVVWAVKPQQLQAAAEGCAGRVAGALQLSIAAGIPCGAVARWTGAARVVRAMPNTPALLGQGMTGLYAAPGTDAGDRQRVERLLASTGRLTWVAHEADIDAVTALSGSGPAYVFYFMESLVRAGAALGLPEAQARALVTQTFRGAADMAQAGDEPLALLRERVTSPGGTTFAALAQFEASALGDAIALGAQAAHRRAGELARALSAS
jgi:pyrroline-5-carboxylate reductase